MQSPQWPERPEAPNLTNLTPWHDWCPASSSRSQRPLGPPRGLRWKRVAPRTNDTDLRASMKTYFGSGVACLSLSWSSAGRAAALPLPSARPSEFNVLAMIKPSLRFIAQNQHRVVVRLFFLSFLVAATRSRSGSGAGCNGVSQSSGGGTSRHIGGVQCSSC